MSPAGVPREPATTNTTNATVSPDGLHLQLDGREKTFDTYTDTDTDTGGESRPLLRSGSTSNSKAHRNSKSSAQPGGFEDLPLKHVCADSNGTGYGSKSNNAKLVTVTTNNLNNLNNPNDPTSLEDHLERLEKEKCEGKNSTGCFAFCTLL